MFIIKLRIFTYSEATHWLCIGELFSFLNLKFFLLDVVTSSQYFLNISAQYFIFTIFSAQTTQI